MKPPGNFLAAGAAPGAPSPAAVPQPSRAVRQPTAAPYKAPVSDGSSQGPLIGDRQKIAKPPLPSIGSSARASRPYNDVSSGMSAAMGAMADHMHPVRKR